MVAKSEEKQSLVPDGLRKRGGAKNYGSVSSVATGKGDHDHEDDDEYVKNSTSRCERIYISVILIIAILGIIIGEATLIPIALDKIERTKNCLISVDPGVYPEAAVATDDSRCSNIARDILIREGSAVDAAIAAMICIGVVVPHSAGIGGGTFISIYKKDDLHRAYTLNARETAPKAAFEDMYANNSDLSSEGGLAIAVPGQIKGMWEAHQKFGRLPWSSLFEDSIKLCREGAKVSATLARVLMINKDSITNNTGLRDLFWNANTSDVFKEGEVVKNTKLGDTLERISLGGENEFYEKETATILAQDIKDAGGIITKEDLENYKADWVTPITTKLNEMELFGLPSPSGSSFVFFVLNIMERYKLTPESLKTTNASVLTYHRLIEAFKYGLAVSADLGDPKYVNVTEAENKLLSQAYADEILKKISDEKTFNPDHYNADYIPDQDYGTSHLSILAPDGSAVAATTSINLEFGSKVVSPSTGIILNNEMDDFSVKGKVNRFGKLSSPSNYIAPGKRPMSSMSPIIMINTTINNVTAVIGASGGTHITTTISQVMMLKKWLGKKTHEAVAEPRLHHQLYPNYISYEADFPRDILDGLESKGHVLKVTNNPVTSACNAIFHTDHCITTASDPRKGGQEAAVGL